MRPDTEKAWTPRHTGIAIGLDDVMPFQPGLVGDMRPGGGRPPPAGKVALALLAETATAQLRQDK